jgi:hypothetical protein
MRCPHEANPHESGGFLLSLLQWKYISNTTSIMELLHEWNFLFATLAAMGIGALWYSSFSFGPIWARLSNIDFEDPVLQARMRKRAPFLYVRTFLALLVMMVLFRAVYDLLGGTTMVQGVVLGVTVWAGFTATTSLVNYSFGRRPLGLWFIDNGYHLLSLIVAGMIFGL